MKYITIVGFSAVLLTSGALFADDSTPSASPVAGAWTGACDAWGTPATCHSTWRQGLHARHWVQVYTIIRTRDQATLFSGRGLYRLNDEDQADGYWEDSQGSVHPLAGQFEDGALTVTWGSLGTELGRSRYDFRDGTLRVQDEVLDDEGWRVFMTVDYGQAD